MSNNALGRSLRWVADCELRGVWCGVSRTKASNKTSSKKQSHPHMTSQAQTWNTEYTLVCPSLFLPYSAVCYQKLPHRYLTTLCTKRIRMQQVPHINSTQRVLYS